MQTCIFCQIVKGKIPCYKVYEDKDFLGFLDIRPLTKGNSLLVPKKHYRWVDDIPNFGAYFTAAKKIAQASQRALGSYATCYITLGFEVSHAHIRIVPRYKNKKDDQQPGMPKLKIINHYSEKEMQKIAKEILNEVGPTKFS
jgi:histidine triad (HIT) family protein